MGSFCAGARGVAGLGRLWQVLAGVRGAGSKKVSDSVGFCRVGRRCLCAREGAGLAGMGEGVGGLRAWGLYL